MVEWKDFNPIAERIDKWLPQEGEGDNMATQAVTALSKLVYRWYNDGDVYDNRYCMEGWCNDLSSYANWLYNNLGILRLSEIETIMYDNQYSQLLFDIASQFNEDYLKKLEKEPKVGSIYTEEGPFKFEEWDEDDWEEDDW